MGRLVILVLALLVLVDVYFLDSKYLNAGIKLATQIAKSFGI
jgi:hypothetical protein